MTSHALSEPAVIGCLAEMVEARSGLKFAGSRRPELVTKARRAAADHACASLGDYQRLLSGPAGGPVLDHLVETLTVGETYFFRHRPYFDLLRREVLPEVIARRQHTRQVRAWCAGCASGEEAYSVAILLREALPEPSEWDVAILATDVNQRFLALAQAATYGDWSFRETGDDFKRAYFTRSGARYRVVPEIRRLVHIAHLNLATDAYPSFTNGTAGLDLVFCRNVLIYFGPDLASRVLASLTAALVDGGCLVLGPSDPSPGPSADLAPLSGPDAVIYRRSPSPTVPVAPPEPLRQLPPHERPPKARPRSLARAASPPLAEGPPGPAASVAAGWRGLCQVAREQANEGRLEKARVLCEQAIALAGLEAEPYYLLATVCDAAGDDTGALAGFRKAIYLQPGFTPAYLGMAAIHRRAGRSDLARREMSRAFRRLGDREADEIVLAAEGLTVGRLRDALTKGLA